jgi:hypothetical protein
MNKIRLLLEYKTYPIWIYDEEGLVIDTDLPAEWSDDSSLDDLWNEVADFYDTLFIDNPKEFRFLGFKSLQDKVKFADLVKRAKQATIIKNNGKYHIQDDIDVDRIPLSEH